MSRKIHSFKYNKATGEIAIDYENERNGVSDILSIKTKDAPRKALTDSLQAMAKHLVAICELPESWLPSISVRGIRCTYKKGIQGLVIRATRELEHANAPMAINSPHTTEELIPESDEEVSSKNTFSAHCLDDLDDLTSRIFEYIDGDRMQIDAFVDE